MSAHNIKSSEEQQLETIWAEQALTAGGWQENVAVEVGRDGVITSIKSGSPPVGTQTKILIPAPTNLHSHAFQRAMAGLTERRGPDPNDNFWTWRKLMYAYLDRLSPEDVEAITAYVQMEMLEAGYGASVEFHYLHHQQGGVPYDDPAEMASRVVSAASDTGIGLTLLPVLYEFGGCDRRPLGPGQIRFGNKPDAFAKIVDASAGHMKLLPGDCVTGVAPHSLRAASVDGIKLATALRPGKPVHMHVAEQTGEVDEVLQAWGRRPMAWVLSNHPVDKHWCLIHCTHMVQSEIAVLAKSGAVAGLCPITESSLGDGIFEGTIFLGLGGRIGIGSDSNIKISLSEELRTLEYSQRLRDRRRAVFATPEKSTGRVLFEAAAAGGAQAAGRKAGKIAPGQLADLLALDGEATDLEGRRGDTVLDSFIFAGNDRMVKHVWSAGRHLVTDGRHRKHDRITGRYRNTMRRLGQEL